MDNGRTGLIRDTRRRMGRGGSKPKQARDRRHTENEAMIALAERFHLMKSRRRVEARIDAEAYKYLVLVDFDWARSTEEERLPRNGPFTRESWLLTRSPAPTTAPRTGHATIRFAARGLEALPAMPPGGSEKARGKLPSLLLTVAKALVDGDIGCPEQLHVLCKVCLARPRLALAIGEATDVLDRRGFRKNMNVDKKDFAAIEYLLRAGRRKLEMYSSPGTTNIQ